MTRKLTARQRKFVNEYIKLGNATQAAINAGYSKNGVRQIASRLLTNANVSEAINKRMKSKDKKDIASQDEVLQYLTSVMRGEPQNVHNKSTKITNGTKVESELKGTFTPSEEARTDAAKELLKRYVVASNDEAKARARKLEAEADIAEAKAKLLTSEEATTEQQVALLLDKFKGEV